MFYVGNIILYKDGPNWISKLIRLIEGNDVTHCAVVIEQDPIDPYILEIKNFFSQVRIVKYSETLIYTDEIYKAVFSDNKNIFSPINLTSLMQIYGGKKYSGISLINAMINHFIGLFKKDYKYKVHFAVNKKYTCSSLCASVLNSLNITDYLDPSLIEPDDFTILPWKTERIK